MNNSIRKALLLDAFYQVLDNKVFRLLVFMIGIVVLLSCLFGFREEQVEVLFGRWTLRYDQLPGLMSESITGEELRVFAIQFFQSKLVDALAGIFGMILCVAATSFFVPRMLERGSADIAFSKPLSRFRLLLARYFAGILFVTLLAVLLIGGVYIGLLIGSGYNDPGFLWSILTLVYLFALLHSVSTLIGVLTRSTVASILVTIMFFWFNGCIQQGWITYEYMQQKEIAELLRNENIPPELLPVTLEEEGGTDKKKPNSFMVAMFRTVKVLHYTGPKTTDAGFVSTKFLAALHEDELADEEAKLTIESLPDALARTEPSSSKVDLEDTAVVWSGEGELEGLRVELTRSPRTPPEPNARRMSSSRAAQRYKKNLDEASIEGELAQDRFVVDRLGATLLTWTETTPTGARRRETGFFAFGEWMFQLEATYPEELAARASAAVRELGQAIRFARDAELMAPDQWYERRLGWTSELKFNLFFSIGSSIAFAMVMLLIAWWRLTRIDF